MTALSAIQLQWLQDELDGIATDEQLQTRYEDLGSVRGVALAVLRARRAELLSKPLKTSLSGVASVDWSANLKALELRIAAIAGLDDDPTDEPGEDADAEDLYPEPVQLTRSRGR